MIVISSVSLLVNKNNISTQQQIETIKQEIVNLQKVESQQVYLTSKLKSFKTLIETQKAHQSVTETIFALIPPGTELKGFKVETEGMINISGSVLDYESLVELMDRIKKDKRLQATNFVSKS